MGCFPWEVDLLLQAGKDQGPACCPVFRAAAWWPDLFLFVMFPMRCKHGMGAAQLPAHPSCGTVAISSCSQAQTLKPRRC